MLDDGEAQPRTAVVAGAVYFVEPLEDVGKVLGGYPGAVVRDPDLDGLIVGH